MKQKVKYISIIIVFMLLGCIEEFKPQINESFQVIVINGTITNQEGYQYVEISKTSSYNKPENLPEINCVVEVKDNLGNKFLYEEYKPGKYRSFIGDEYLQIGAGFVLNVKTADGKEYASNQTTILPCAPVKDVRFDEKEKQSSNSDVSLIGVQFYVDVDGLGDSTNYFRWEIEETWEYVAQKDITHFYDAGEVERYEYTDEIKVCWYTDQVKELFTNSSSKLSSNNLKNVPLHYVTDETNRLRYKYSALIKQLSLSPEAFQYWDGLRLQGAESGSLYQGQPATLASNIYNVNDSDEEVLGYFDASAVTEKRIFVDAADLSFGVFDYTCAYDTLSVGKLKERFGYNPVLPILLHNIFIGEDTLYGYSFQPCFDCTRWKGDNIKPDFWE